MASIKLIYFSQSWSYELGSNVKNLMVELNVYADICITHTHDIVHMAYRLEWKFSKVVKQILPANKGRLMTCRFSIFVHLVQKKKTLRFGLG